LPGFRSTYQGSSFFELLKIDHPHALPDFARGTPAAGGAVQPGVAVSVPHGTTVLAMKCAEGVLVAGDRLATENYRVASRDIQKVFPTDDHSLMAIAGAAGPCIEMARVLRVELEHYEKIEGSPLELEGKANKLSQMVRQNLPAAMQGLVVVPLFAGYDRRRKTGRLWKYDVTGGRYEEAEFEATGSGSLYARESLKKSWRPSLSREAALLAAVEALVDAADEDRGTGGVDVARGLYPNIFTCDAQGIQEISKEEIAEMHRRVLEARAVRGTP
jgi:proteasome beta subunit